MYVVIVADDHALKVTGSYGNNIIRTPNIDNLAREGIMFTHAYCNSPICSASRQSMLTG
jgi:choline-sulfatase